MMSQLDSTASTTRQRKMDANTAAHHSDALPSWLKSGYKPHITLMHRRAGAPTWRTVSGHFCSRRRVDGRLQPTGSRRMPRRLMHPTPRRARGQSC